MNKTQALVLGVSLILIGAILAILSQGSDYNVEKDYVPKDNTNSISLFVEKGKFVAARIITNPNWTDPNGEGSAYDLGDDGGYYVYATLNITNQHDNYTSFALTYKLDQKAVTLRLWEILPYADKGALNTSSVADPKKGLQGYLFAGQSYIACGETVSSENYTFWLGAFMPPRESPPSRFEIWLGTVEVVYPYGYFMPIGAALITAGFGIPLAITIKERRENNKSKRRPHLNTKATDKKD